MKKERKTIISNNDLSLNREITNIIRGFAICFVIAGHILGGQYGLISTHVTRLLGTGAVNIFLFLSGYGLFQSYSEKGLNLKIYASKKINKVFIPYGIISIGVQGVQTRLKRNVRFESK